MINDLQLKGNELLVYAIIFGFSQNEESHYTGSLSYLADWTNSTKQGVIKNLKALIDKGFIGKVEKTINKVKFCEYYTISLDRGIKQSLTGCSTKFNGGGKQSLPNKIIDNIENNFKKARQVNKFVDKSVYYSDKVLVGNDFKIDYEDEYFYPYRKGSQKLTSSVERWLVKNFLGQEVEKRFICRQIGIFAKKQGNYKELLGLNYD